MLLGRYVHAIDAKGRVAIPAQLRKGLRAGSVVTLGQEGRLVMYPPEEWAEVSQRFRLTPQTPPEERQFARQLFASAREVELDNQGRLLLDSDHRRFAQLEERAVFVGLGNVVEIVGEAVWNAEAAGLTPENFTALGDRIAESTAGAAGSPA